MKFLPLVRLRTCALGICVLACFQHTEIHRKSSVWTGTSVWHHKSGLDIGVSAKYWLLQSCPQCHQNITFRCWHSVVFPCKIIWNFLILWFHYRMAQQSPSDSKWSIRLYHTDFTYSSLNKITVITCANKVIGLMSTSLFLIIQQICFAGASSWNPRMSTHFS